MTPKEPPSKQGKSQHEKFVELARESGAGESEDSFVAKVRAISSTKPRREQLIKRRDELSERLTQLEDRRRRQLLQPGDEATIKTTRKQIDEVVHMIAQIDAEN